jgi:ribosomal protein L14E/L6E/L27E
MEFSAGQIVKSVFGHDAGSFYVIIEMKGGFAFIADGRRRKAEAPKKKNPIHLRATKQFVKPPFTDGYLRKALHSLNFPDKNDNRSATET